MDGELCVTWDILWNAQTELHPGRKCKAAAAEHQQTPDAEVLQQNSTQQGTEKLVHGIH